MIRLVCRETGAPATGASAMQRATWGEVPEWAKALYPRENEKPGPKQSDLYVWREEADPLHEYGMRIGLLVDATGPLAAELRAKAALAAMIAEYPEIRLRDFVNEVMES